MAMAAGGAAVVPMDQQINNRIASSPLAPPANTVPPYQNLLAQRVFIANAWPSINVTGIGRLQGGGLVVQKPVVDPNAFKANLTQQQMMALGWNNGRPSPDAVVRTYLEWGRDEAKKTSFFNVCDGFTCATIAMLVAKQSPLPANTPVEWFGVRLPSGGHAFTVVARDPNSDPAQPATWGNACMVVDQWYALQVGGNATLYVNGPNAHAGYVAWLTGHGATIFRVAGFTSGTYPWLSIPPI